ncbi:MAG: hypothetical protein KatS3mg105_2042 [Gemmatales bacterium]|nr:MAG: hypothetical protein KatS3mg105_2042 [Gemmatales bacterium]
MDFARPGRGRHQSLPLRRQQPGECGGPVGIGGNSLPRPACRRHRFDVGGKKANRVFTEDWQWWRREFFSGNAWRQAAPAIKQLSIDTGDFALSLTPLAGDVRDVAEVGLGVDVVTGKPLSLNERLITAAAAFIPTVGGKALRGLVPRATPKFFTSRTI